LGVLFGMGTAADKPEVVEFLILVNFFGLFRIMDLNPDDIFTKLKGVTKEGCSLKATPPFQKLNCGLLCLGS